VSKAESATRRSVTADLLNAVALLGAGAALGIALAATLWASARARVRVKVTPARLSMSFENVTTALQVNAQLLHQRYAELVKRIEEESDPRAEMGSTEPDRISKKRVNFSRSLSLPMLTEPRYIFRYYTASFYKFACSPKFWVEYANIGRECCQESTKIWHSIVFECCLAHGFRGERAAGAAGMCHS
jgi:hypothetical protein